MMTAATQVLPVAGAVTAGHIPPSSTVPSPLHLSEFWNVVLDHDTNGLLVQCDLRHESNQQHAVSRRTQSQVILNETQKNETLGCKGSPWAAWAFRTPTGT
ncbi:hypothetical protein FA15DRAFT_298415 [Coprinopsis marcescibilis]|uniref:Uncharacterized protein n=1 Tax=Coprinopsis marcescibilis TaxID=230819 RepID=A0A5C3KZY5_COPMA|nr:hypothetical protein FA15DRAFT_298415 [Coprinopsis marcescibilis]